MKRIGLSLIAIVLVLSCAVSRKKNTPATAAATTKADTTKKDSAKSTLKPYKQVITARAVTSKGFLTVHKIEDRYFFEIPDAILNKDILIVNRISKGKYDGPTSTYAGDWVGESMVRFDKGPNNKFFIRERAQDVRAADTSHAGMFRAVESANVQPILAAFDIKALTPDGKGLVLDVTDYVNGDNALIGVDNRMKLFLNWGLGGLQADRSYVQTIRSYPRNVEIKTVKTFSRNPGGMVTYEMNSSLVLLPDQPMQPRFEDPRVGYFLTGYYNFEVDKPTNIDWMIRRWRLEPRDADKERYLRGELVEPQQPIVFYIDPVTPKKWVPYLMQGVNDWQRAFEKAGFKNAIYAREAPTDDSTWSIDDARHNVIVYKASPYANAYGPQVFDPRSGEVLESHVGWWHSVQKILHDWYMVQVSPMDTGARKMQFDDALMGRLIRYVSAHEVGHTLGLLHNFGASATIPVDSMRSKTYVQKNGFCASIMDYARFNYVAQPEDGLGREELMANLGVYDDWAIEWGYRWFPAWKTRAEEKKYLTAWVTSRLEKDKRLTYGSQNIPIINFDPSRQNLDLGDDAIKASRYGIKNLQRVVANLKEWTLEPGGSFQPVATIYNEVLAHFSWYLRHVYTNVGGVYWSDKVAGQKGAQISFPSRARQKAAVQFLQDELFTRPGWLIDHDLYALTAQAPSVVGFNSSYINVDYTMVWDVLYRTMSFAVYYNQLQAQLLQPGDVYTTEELLTDLEAGIFKELTNRAAISEYRRNLQKFYVNRLMDQLNPDEVKKKYYDKDHAAYIAHSDIPAILKAHERQLLAKVNAAIPHYTDALTREHLLELRERLQNSLYIKKEEAPAQIMKGAARLQSDDDRLRKQQQNNLQATGCWDKIPME